MSDQPQPPVLEVPDLVGNLFERLDPASRRAFFQAHPDVAQNGYVLAHTKLQIELRPGSLEDQWQRVLHLTRSQPPHCLVITGHDREQLQDFMRCAPEGKHEEKQKVLQGTEVQLQVLVRVEAGGLQHLQNLMESWRAEEQPRVEGKRVQLVLDLCGREYGRELVAITDREEGRIEPPSCCILRNGTLLLPDYYVIVRCDRVCMQNINIKGQGKQCAMVEVLNFSLTMEGCRVEGGCSDGPRSGAVRLAGAGARLYAKRCSMYSGEGSGLVVREGGKATLEYVMLSRCGWNGVQVGGEGSMVSATHCCMDGCGGNNVNVWGGGYACLRQTSCNSSEDWHGMCLAGKNSCLDSSECSASGSRQCGVHCAQGAHAILSHVTADENGSHGLCAQDQGTSLVVSRSSACRNESCGAAVFDASASLSTCTANNNEEEGFYAHGSGSSLVAKSCQAQDNKRGNTGEVCGGRVICLDE